MAVGALLLGIALGAVAAVLVMRARLQADRGRLEAQLDAERRVLEERLALTVHTQDGLSDTFKALCADALRQSNTSFLELARTQLEGFQAKATTDLVHRQQAVERLVDPIRLTLEKVGTEVKQLENARQQAYGALSQQVTSMARSQDQLRLETTRLVKSLRTPGVRGRWGELQLRRAVEAAGMSLHCDFTEQSTSSGDGGLLRPDLVVKLPGGKHVVVDAKAPIEALLAAHDEEDEVKQAARMKDYARNVRDHMGKLSAKAYWQQFAPTPDFVVMFLPGESFFHYALEHDPLLLEQGPQQRVVLASPSTLITLLRTVALVWREEKLAESAQAVSELGRDLYERLSTMGAHVARLGSRLDKAVEAYNETVGSLETRVLPAARRFPELGISSKSELPPVSPIERAPRPLTAAELTGDAAALVQLAAAKTDAA